MFKRKDSDDDGTALTLRDDTAPRSGIVTLSAPQTRPSSLESAETANRPTPSMRPAPEPYRRIIEVPNPTRPVEAAPAAAEANPESKRLIVGRDISLDGKISSCDRLIVEGWVEAELQDCHTIEITESGTVKGAAEIESAEVSGHYEGSLTVRKNLLIRSTGHVSGAVRYGRLEIEQGGEINGDIKSLGLEHKGN
ncbi:MAG: polymer-forming cytoskeletal protein [Alphaproteobacteria bacterium]